MLAMEQSRGGPERAEISFTPRDKSVTLRHRDHGRCPCDAFAAVAKASRKRRNLHYRRRADPLDFYSYDSVQNPWLGGGGAYRDLEILSRLAPRCVRVRLYVGSFPGARPHVVRGVEVIPLGFGKSEIVSRLTYVIAANGKLLTSGPSRTEHEPVGIALSPYCPLPAALRHRRRLFGVLHHIIGDNWVRKLGVVGHAVAALERRYYRIAPRVVTVNGAVAEEVLRLNPEADVLRTGNGYDPTLLELPDASADSQPFLLFIGRLDRFMKGLDLLVESFARLATRFPDLTLVLAGRGDKANEDALRALAAARGVGDRVIIRKDIDDADKKDLLSRCLLFCSPSRFEGFGIAALEANAAGKAVVVSEASGYKDSIAHGVSGLRVDLARAENLDEAISALLEDPERRALLGRQARAWARGFSWDAIAEREGEWLDRTR